MARTTPMRLVELMILKSDISTVVEFLGKQKNFQFQDRASPAPDDEKNKENPDEDILLKLQQARQTLAVDDISSADVDAATVPTEKDRADAKEFLQIVESLYERELAATDELHRATDALTEAKAFSNLKVPYSELDHLSFLSLRIGKIDPTQLDVIKAAIGNRAVIVPLGEDKSRILAATSKRARFSLDTELKNLGFVPIEIPESFAGVPDEILGGLEKEASDAENTVKILAEEKKNLATTHAALLRHLLATFSISSQIQAKLLELEATNLVYRITGWIPERNSHQMMKDLDKITEGRIAIRVYQPKEVPTVISGVEKVPVSLKHGKFVSAFERMIFSYGSPVYGTIDPTPFVALFFTLLFGIMFGDAGQGLVFLLAGLLMSKNIIKVGNWNKFAPIFIGIGCTSMVMGFLTGEFFANSQILLPASRFIKGLFGVTDPEALNEPILEMMPSASRIKSMFIFFGFTCAVGFFINSIGLVINIINLFSRGKIGKALFGKTGISGTVFFWYVIILAVRIAAFHHSVSVCDLIVVGLTLIGTAFSEPLARLVDGQHPVIENGMLTFFIEAFVELLELVSTYLSNSISFVRVGAFALAHAVLGYIIGTLMNMVPVGANLLVGVIGNGIVVVLEGMIVAIQVIRLQYYEFFSKFFNETGKEFKPFAFEYK